MNPCEPGEFIWCLPRMFDQERNDRIDHETLDLSGLLRLEREAPRDVDLLVRIGRHYLKQRQLAK